MEKGLAGLGHLHHTVTLTGPRYLSAPLASSIVHEADLPKHLTVGPLSRKALTENHYSASRSFQPMSCTSRQWHEGEIFVTICHDQVPGPTNAPHAAHIAVWVATSVSTHFSPRLSAFNMSSLPSSSYRSLSQMQRSRASFGDGLVKVQLSCHSASLGSNPGMRRPFKNLLGLRHLHCFEAQVASRQVRSHTQYIRKKPCIFPWAGSTRSQLIVWLPQASSFHKFHPIFVAEIAAASSDALRVCCFMRLRYLRTAMAATVPRSSAANQCSYINVFDVGAACKWPAAQSRMLLPHGRQKLVSLICTAHGAPHS